MLAHVFLDELQRRRIAVRHAFLDSILRRVECSIGAFPFSEVETDVRQQLDGRIEQCAAFEPVRFEYRQLEDQPGAVRVADERGVFDTGGFDRLQHVGYMRADRPRWLPRRGAVASQIGCEDAEARGEAFVRKSAESPAEAADAVQCDNRGRHGVAPLVQLEEHD